MMITKLSRFLFSTLRGRLIVSVALVHAVMMALFIYDLTARQRAMLLERQVEEATALSHTLAVSAAGWIAANDIAGLLELVEAQKRYPELLFAMLVDERGRVLADTDTRRSGLYLQDLPRDSRQAVLSQNPALVDVAVPAMIGARHVGWARVGIGQKEGSRKLAEITRDGVFYALAAILVGSAVAWFMGLRITKRLYFVQQTIDAVSSGDRTARSSIAGDDEAAVMAREFNSMLDKLAGRDAELCASEERFRLVFENSPVSIWEEDFSGVKGIFDDLKMEGITDLEGYFEEHPETVRDCVELVKILDVNQAALALHGAESKEELFAGLLNTFTPESFDTFRHELLSLWRGDVEMTRDAVVKTLAGEARQVTVYFSVCPGYEKTFSKVLVSLADITDRKLAEEAVRLNLAQQKALLEVYQKMTTAQEREIIAFVVDKCVNLTGSAIGFVGLVSDDNGHMEAHIWSETAMENCPLDKPLDFPITEAGLWAEAIRQRRMMIVNDYSAPDPLKKGCPEGHLELSRFMGIPVLDNDRVVAVAGVANKPEYYSESDQYKVSLLLKGMWDIIKRKRAEEALGTLNEELEKRVCERTSELEAKNAELHKMNKLFVDRELRMLELKERIRELEGKTAGK